MQFTRLLFVALAVVLAGCAAPKYNYAPESIAISEPAIGSITVARIGETMLRQGKYQEHDAFRLVQQQEVGWAYTLHPGIYLKTGDDEAAEYFRPSGGAESGRVEKSFIADPWKAIMTRRATPDVCVVTVLNAYVCSPAVGMERRKQPVLASDAFQQTLLYNGRVGSKINIAYREFSNNTARPAFNNTVEYDLNESTEIAYKGAQLEVLEATNQHIKFKLIRNFNEAR